jgi:CBS domain-containing protein
VRASEADLLWLATLADAQAITGDRARLAPVARHLRACLADRPDLLAEMARAAVAFHAPSPSLAGWSKPRRGWISSGAASSPGPRRPGALPGGGDLETSTTGRIEALVGQGRLSRDYGTNLAEAFRLFMRLRLRSQLQEGDGRVRVADLGPAERDLLRHALHQVKKFQQWLTLHFRLRQ